MRKQAYRSMNRPDASPRPLILALAGLLGVRVLVTHRIGRPDRLLRPVARAVAKDAPRVVCFGHSHRPYTVEHGGILFLNPGGAGPPRFGLPRSVALLHLEGGRAGAEIVYLEGSRTTP